MGAGAGRRHARASGSGMKTFSVFNGDVRLGLLLDRGDSFLALSSAGVRLGRFKSLDSATRALVQASEPEEQGSANVTFSEGECLVDVSVAEKWCAMNVNVTLHRGRRVTAKVELPGGRT